MHLVEKDEILFEQEEEKMLQKDSKTSNYYLMGLVESRKRKKKSVSSFSRKSTHLLSWYQSLLFEWWQQGDGSAERL